MNGRIVVYTGPMFASKSVMLFFAYDKCKIAKKKVLIFKPKNDDRFGNDVIKSRMLEQTLEAINISDLSELVQYDTEVYIIDEFQFLQGDIAIVDRLANEGKEFYIAGLDKTAEGKPFGLMPELLAIADQVHKGIAICNDCGQENAIHSFFLGEKDKDIFVGDGEYVPLCRSCWYKRMNLKRKGKE